MADKTQINLERIRACDAEWEESKHPRSENGQFTSGSGVKVSKATPAMKGGKFKNATKTVKEYADQERLGKNLMHNELNPLLHPEMERFHNAVKSETDRVIKEGKKEKKKRDAAKATLENARPKIAAMRQLAKAAAPASKKDALVKKVNSDPKPKAQNNDLFSEEERRILKNAGSGWAEAMQNNEKQIAESAYKKHKPGKPNASVPAAPAAKPAKADSAKESVKSALNKHIKQIKSNFAQYPDQAQNLSKDATEMFKKAEKAGALEKAAEFLKRKEKLDAEMVKQDKSGNRNEWYDGLSDEDKNLVGVSVTGVLLMAMRKVEESNALREHLKKKEEHKANLLRKVIASENAKTPAAKSKPTTRFDKDMAKADKSYEDFREVMQKRKSEIDVLNERLRTTKNSFVAKATKQELDRLVSEYNQLDEMY